MPSPQVYQPPRTRVKVVTTRHPQALGKDAEVHTVVLLTVNRRAWHGECAAGRHCHGTNEPGGVGGEATREVVVHDDGHIQRFRKLCPLHHLRRWGR